MAGEDGAELGDDGGLLGGDVARFDGVGGVVVEFDLRGIGGGAGFLPLDEAVALGADRATEIAAGETVVGVIAHAGGGIFQHGHEAGAVDWQRAGGLGQAGEFGERGIEVDGFGELAGGGAGAGDAGRDHDERYAVGLLKIGVLGPDAEVAEVPAVVAPEDDDGVVGEFQFVERGHDAADLHVSVAHARVVTVDELALDVIRVGMHGRLGHGEKRVDLTAAFHGHRHGAVRGGLARGHGEFGGIVEVPVFLRRGEGEVRAHEAHGEEEGVGGFFFRGAQARDRVGGDAGIGVGVVGHLGRFPSGAARERAGAGRAAEVGEEGLLVGG